MRGCLELLTKFLAIIASIFFVLTAVIALVLFNLESRVFDADTYKQALLDQNIYERMPAILGEVLSSSASLNPCASNPITCGLEGRSPEAISCFENALGAGAYAAIT